LTLEISYCSEEFSYAIRFIIRFVGFLAALVDREPSNCLFPVNRLFLQT